MVHAPQIQPFRSRTLAAGFILATARSCCDHAFFDSDEFNQFRQSQRKLALRRQAELHVRFLLGDSNPSGTRQGKVVVVQHRSISDSDTDGRYTVKLYVREKVPAEGGGWAHERITLRPDSDQLGFESIILQVDGDEEGVAVVAEMLMVLESTKETEEYR